MAKLIEFQKPKSYASRANAVKAVEAKFDPEASSKLDYVIVALKDGRFLPVFLGERALQAGVHFHFNIVA